MMPYIWVVIWCLIFALFGWVGGFCFGWFKGEWAGADDEWRRLTGLPTLADYSRLEDWQ